MTNGKCITCGIEVENNDMIECAECDPCFESSRKLDTSTPLVDKILNKGESKESAFMEQIRFRKVPKTTWVCFKCGSPSDFVWEFTGFDKYVCKDHHLKEIDAMIKEFYKKIQDCQKQKRLI